MSDVRYKVGFLGAGYISEWHAKALRAVSGAQLVAICDRARGRAEEFARGQGVEKVYASLDEMLAGEKLDAVHVLTPPEHHFAPAKALIDAGVAVYLEKPMCATVEDCDALLELAKQKNALIGVGHNFLFAPEYERLRQDVKEGRLGRIDHVTITWNKELPQAQFGPFDHWMFAHPGNILLEVGPHSVSHLLDLIGKPEEIHAHPTNGTILPGGRRFYRRWQVRAYRGPTAIDLKWSFIPGFGEHTIHVRGTLASATADLDRGTYTLHAHTPKGDDFNRYAMLAGESRALKRQARSGLTQTILSKLKLNRYGNPYGTSIARAAEAFYATLGSGQADPRCSAQLGRDTVDVCTSIGRQAPQEELAAETTNVEAPQPPSQPDTLVLGATGFIGRELVKQLVAAGKQVRILARSKGRLTDELRALPIDVVQGDMSNADDLDRALAGVSVVYHLARGMGKVYEDYLRTDVEPTRLVGEKCLEHGIKRLIYTGTIDSYYAGARAGTITEDTPLDPKIEGRNPYARAKAEGERLLLEMHRQRGLPLVIFRPGIVIGRGTSPFHWGVGMWWNNAICQMWGDGTNELPIVLVEDVADALVRAWDAEGIDGESFNLIGDVRLTAREYLDELERVTGTKLQKLPTPIARFYTADMAKWVVKCMVRHPGRVRPRYHDWESRTQRARFDSTKAKQRLDWHPTADREQVIRQGLQAPAEELMA